MPPHLALLLCLCFVAWLFWQDKKQRQFTSRALWIPFLWLFIIGSRPVSYWFSGGDSSGTDLGGNPINTVVFAVLIVGAIAVLQRRNFEWARFFQDNKALMAIYLFFAISAAWSPLGIISFKRIFKDFGTVLVALVLLTEMNPTAAIRTVFVRVSYLLFPLSIVVNKYFPTVGRNYSPDGGQMVTGLTTQKNSLGEMVVVFGLMALWDLLVLRQENGRARWGKDRLIRYGLLAMGAYLLITCDSVTSMICVMLGCFGLWGGAHVVRMKNGRAFLVYCLIGVVCLIALNGTFHIFDTIVEAFGRNPTLTGRTEIWHDVLEQHTNPLIGCGFYSFWDSSYGRAANALIGVPLNEAHNGYLDVYLDGGWVGVTLLVVLLLSAGRRALNRLFDGDLFGRMAFAFWLIAILYNNSESDYFRLGTIWFAFLLLTTGFMSQRQEIEEKSRTPANAELSSYAHDS